MIKIEARSQTPRLMEIPLLLIILVAFAGPMLAQVPLAQLSLQKTGSGSVSRGEALFIGQVPFKNGGPPCASCHSISGLPFPNGGTLGPDITGVPSRFGPQGLQLAVKTLYFPVMNALYGNEPLTSDERADLLAFIQQSATQPKSRWTTQIILLIAFGGFLILLLLTHFLWRDRLKSVRRKMVERAMREGGSYS